jgi:SAM-dependent methyltransferase
MVQSGVSSAAPFEEALGTAMALTRNVEILAAIVANIRSGDVVHPDIAAHLDAITRTSLPQLEDLSTEQLQTIAGLLTSIFRQAADLIDRPERPPGWEFTDPVVLQATGGASMSVAGVLAQIAPTLPGLSDALASGGSFCDVGTGTGWLSIAAAKQWPHTDITGIDIHDAALELATRNVIDAGLTERITLRQLDVADLDGLFDLIWLPGPFLPARVIPAALDAARRCLHAGGWLVFGLYGGPPDPLTTQLSDLRTVRSGGHPWTAVGAVDALRGAGFEQVGEVTREWNAPVRVVVARNH